MKEIQNLIRDNNLKVNRYSKNGKIIIVETKNKKYVIQPKNQKNEIFNYLINRNFKYYPSIIDYDDKYELVEYIDEIDIPKEQKINDLINFVALLHSKTTYYKEIDVSDYKKLYEDLRNNVLYLLEYYNDIITIIDSKIYPSPWEYLLARNISLFFSNLKYCEDEIDAWYKMVEDSKKIRVSVIHNNLKLDHFLQNEANYLISWDKSRIDIPIFDLYKLYLNNFDNFDFSNILINYQKKYPLKKEELKLFLILINMPLKLEFNDTNYNLCIYIKKEIDKLTKSHQLIEILQ